MEFRFDINGFLGGDITLVTDQNVKQTRQLYQSSKLNSENAVKQNLSKVINEVGVASAKAQGLNAPITSSLKLQHSDHHLYILKDAESNNGQGVVIGIIRVGIKKLFLSDNYGQLHECSPLCVLDFYVHESKQRSGYGKKLFQHMIQHEKVEAHQVAIDRPSSKFLSFLQKHYKLGNAIQQMNRFVVFDSFFHDLTAVGGVESNRRRSAPNRRNMFFRNLDTRTTQSANIRGRNNRETNNQTTTKTVTNELSKFQLIPPISRKESTDSIKSTDSSESLTKRPQASQGVRRPNLSSYSRYSDENITLQNNSQPSIRSRHTTKTTSHTNLPGNPQNIKTHTLQSNNVCDRNITSLDSPFSSHSNNSITTKNSTLPSSTPNKDLPSRSTSNTNYTIDTIIDELTMNNRRLGTSWNVFGVPATNSSSTRNPYAKVNRRGFPS